MVGGIDGNALRLQAVSCHGLSCSSSKSLNYFSCQLGETKTRHKIVCSLKQRKCTYLHNTEGGHCKINFVVFPNVWDNLLDHWCWSDVFYDACNIWKYMCIDFTRKSWSEKTIQTYVGKFHPLVHIQGHRHTEMNQWCLHRQCWLDKCLSDWLLPPNTHWHLYMYGLRHMLRMWMLPQLHLSSCQHTSTTGHVNQQHISISARAFKGPKCVCAGLIAGVGGYTLIIVYWK